MGTAAGCWTRWVAAWATTSTWSTARSSWSQRVTAATRPPSTTEASRPKAGTPQCGPLQGPAASSRAVGGKGVLRLAGVHHGGVGGQVVLRRLDQHAGDDGAD